MQVLLKTTKSESAALRAPGNKWCTVLKNVKSASVVPHSPYLSPLHFASKRVRTQLVQHPTLGHHAELLRQPLDFLRCLNERSATGKQRTIVKVKEAHPGKNSQSLICTHLPERKKRAQSNEKSSECVSLSKDPGPPKAKRTHSNPTPCMNGSQQRCFGAWCTT